MAEEASVAESAGTDLIDSLRQNYSGDVSILMVGKGGSGKTALANAILRNNSSGGHFGPDKGNDKILTSKSIEVEQLDVKVTVHDLMGFEDMHVSNERIMRTVRQRLNLDELTAVLVCFKWDDRFDMVAQRTLKLLHDLEQRIWEKVIFALTHFDRVSPDFQEMDADDRNMLLRKTLTNWRATLTVELGKLGVDKKVIDNMQIAPTTHTAIRVNFTFYGLFNVGVTNWLENLWLCIIKNAAKYRQPLVKILNLLKVYLFHLHPSVVAVVVAVGDVEKFLTKEMIGSVFLGGAIGGAVTGALSGLLLPKLIPAVISTVGVVAAATGGVFVGAVAIATLVAVVLYYKQQE